MNELFENSEGNLIIANSLLECLSRKLPVSRLQRDLTDSTILRNLGTIFAYSFISYSSTLKDLHKLQLNKNTIKTDLENNYLIIAEALQTILRKYRIDNAYEIFKNFTRNTAIINQQTITQFINQLDVKENIKDELKTIVVTK